MNPGPLPFTNVLSSSPDQILTYGSKSSFSSQNGCQIDTGENITRGVSNGLGSLGGGNDGGPWTFTMRRTMSNNDFMFIMSVSVRNNMQAEMFFAKTLMKN